MKKKKKFNEISKRNYIKWGGLAGGEIKKVRRIKFYNTILTDPKRKGLALIINHTLKIDHNSNFLY